MSKQLFVGGNDTDFIINSTFLPNTDDKRDVIWHNKSEWTASGKERVTSVMWFEKEHDEYGRIIRYYPSFISKKDILDLAEKIKEMELVEKIDKVPEELPF